MRRFEFVEGSSSKFWEPELKGNTFIVTFGRIGTAGQRREKAFADEAGARKEYEKKVAEKLREGYREVTEGGAAEAAPTPAPRINLVKPRTLGLPDTDVVLGLRPEHLEVGQDAPPPGALEGHVYLVEPMGAESWVTVDVAGERLVARAAGDFRVSTGAPAWLRYDASRLRRFDAKSGRAL